MNAGRIFLLVLLGAGALLFFSSAYSVAETEQVIITEFGKAVGGPIIEPGLHFKKPFVQEVRRFEKRVVRWDGEPREISTREKKFIFIDTMARWRIADPLVFLQSVGDAHSAQQRLDNVIDGVLKDTISSQTLIDIVRVTQRKMVMDVDDVAGGNSVEAPEIAVTVGRDALMEQVTREAAVRVKPLGIDLLDVQITRVNFVEKVLEDVYRRMISERQRIATRFRSEGQGDRARIVGQLEKEQKRILSEAFRDSEKIRGDADAAAARTYADAYAQDPEFYAFLKTLETMKSALADGTTTVVLSSNGELFRLLQSPLGK